MAHLRRALGAAVCALALAGCTAGRSPQEPTRGLPHDQPTTTVAPPEVTEPAPEQPVVVEPVAPGETVPAEPIAPDEPGDVRH